MTSVVSARPAGAPRMPTLDALRGVGATAVVAGHVTFATGAVGMPYWGYWFSRLEVFVSVFFVLSGFVLFRPYAHARATGTPAPTLGRHFWRRSLRIIPAYWLVVVACFLFLAPGQVPWQTWVQHFTFTQFYSQGGLMPGIGQAWSLTVEVVFYLFLPFFAILALGKRWRPARTVAICLLLVPVTVAWALALGYGQLNIFVHPLWFPSHAGSFGVGMALATAHVALNTGTAPRRWALLDDLASAPWACIGFTVGLFALTATPIAGPQGGIGIATGSEYAVRLLLYMTMASCLLVPVAFGRGTSLHGFLSSMPMRWLGTVSFGLFLWHPLAMHIIEVVSGVPQFGRDPLTMFAMTMVLALLLAAMSWYGVERPIVNWGRNVGRSRRAARPAGGDPQPRQRRERHQLWRRRRVAEDHALGEPVSQQEHGWWQQPQQASGAVEAAPVVSWQPLRQHAHHEGEQYATERHGTADRPAEPDQGQPAQEQWYQPTGEAAPSTAGRFVGRASVPPRQYGDHHDQHQQPGPEQERVAEGALRREAEHHGSTGTGW
ncbi:peptidoglycan/LPS O-acetylase OafA/YrhL [Allocatelliglobosispora scoriae]|uniref:Peptidoglycan/LPS O-acetylase OafA/YrhL n=1 Tax=Allocatelliglobosispora scoriae TaxID=643052 RepID=A0A841BR38_9ACTN|nr:peptidoglycan/LPS O-acetylase OafA/YrhL [Allocatelliglobosispora scoriae]